MGEAQKQQAPKKTGGLAGIVAGETNISAAGGAHTSAWAFFCVTAVSSMTNFILHSDNIEYIIYIYIYIYI